MKTFIDRYFEKEMAGKLKPFLILLVVSAIPLLNWLHISEFPYLNQWDDAIYAIKSVRGVIWAIEDKTIISFFKAIPAEFPPMVFISNGIGSIIFGKNALSLRLVHTLWFALFGWGCFRIGKRLGSYGFGLFTVIFSCSILQDYSGQVLMEPSMFAAVSWSIYYLLEIGERRTVKNAVFLGIFVAIGALSKVTFIPIFGVAAVVVLVSDWLENKDSRIFFLALVSIVTAFVIAGGWYVPNLKAMAAYAQKSRYWAPHSLGPVFALTTFKKYFLRLYVHLGRALSFLIIFSIFLSFGNMLKTLRKEKLVGLVKKHKVELLLVFSCMINFIPLLFSDNKNARFISPLLVPISFLVIFIFQQKVKDKRKIIVGIFAISFIFYFKSWAYRQRIKLSPPKYVVGEVIEKLASVSLKYPGEFFWTMGESIFCNKKMLHFEMLALGSDLHFASLCPYWEYSLENVLKRLESARFFFYVKNPSEIDSMYRTKLQEKIIKSLPPRFKVVKSWKDPTTKDEFYLYADLENYKDTRI